MGNRLQWRDGTLNITEMGLLDDYFNAWFWIYGTCQNADFERPESRDKPSAGLNRKVRRYADYVRENIPDKADEILSASDPWLVSIVDNLVDEFNQKVQQGAVTPNLALDYCDRTRRLIYGKGIRRLW